MIYRDVIKVGTLTDSFYDITKKVDEIVANSGVADGLCNVFVKATTAALLINENDRMLIEDFLNLVSDMAPEDRVYQHQENGYSHLRASMLNNGITIPVANRKLFIGAWQNILLFEFDAKNRNREIVVTVYGP